MIVPCVDCGAAMDWTLGEVGRQPMLMSNCRHCNPGGAWFHEPVEVIRKPRGKAGLWPAPKDVPLAPVDTSEV